MFPGNFELDLVGQRSILGNWFKHSHGTVPALRNALDIAEFVGEIAYITLLEKTPDDFLVRVAGTDVRARFGGDVSGYMLSDLARKDRVAGRAFMAVHESISRMTPQMGVHTAANGLRHYWLRVPLSSRHGRSDLVLCHDRQLRADYAGPALEGENSVPRRTISYVQ